MKKYKAKNYFIIAVFQKILDDFIIFAKYVNNMYLNLKSTVYKSKNIDIFNVALRIVILASPNHIILKFHFGHLLRLLFGLGLKLRTALEFK